MRAKMNSQEDRLKSEEFRGHSISSTALASTYVYNMPTQTRERQMEEMPQSELPTHQTTEGAGHKERHSNQGEVVHDAIIGFADGLTVPFALTAGLSS